ncbi:hypothetical protein Tco_0262843, partial [Tanacetum coccineum]
MKLMITQPMYPILVFTVDVQIHKFWILELVALMKNLLQISNLLTSFIFSLFSPPQEEHHLPNGHRDLVYEKHHPCKKMNSNSIVLHVPDAGPSIEERAILFLEAQDRVKKGPL